MYYLLLLQVVVVLSFALGSAIAVRLHRAGHFQARHLNCYQGSLVHHLLLSVWEGPGQHVDFDRGNENYCQTSLATHI